MKAQANGFERSEVARQNAAAIGRFYADSFASSMAAGDAIDQAFARQMHDVHAGYFAGSSSRYLPRPPGVNPSGTGADYHYQSEQQYFMIVERARFDDRENMVIGQGVTRAVANIVQDGFGLQIETGDSGLDAELMAKWRDWSSESSNCDHEGERNWEQLVRSMLRTRIVDGDVFALPTTDGKVQAVENHRCRNPHRQGSKITGGSGIIHGVEIRNERREAFHFVADNLAGTQALTARTKVRRIPARDEDGNRQVFQVYDPRRFNQRRGVSAFAPIVFPTRYHDDLQFAAMVNAKRSSFIAIVRQFKDAEIAPPDRQGGSRTEVTRSDGTTSTEEGGSPGQTLRGVPGEEIKPWSANIPAPAFFDHSAMLLSIIAINLDLPELVFLLDASKTNFNGYRGVIDQARLRFTQIQTDMIAQFHSPVFRWKVRQWTAMDPVMARASVRSGINLLGHRWTPRGWPYIQPVQDAAADDLRLTKNLTSGRRRAQERGIDYDDLTTEIVEDRAILVVKAIDKANEINTKYPDAGLSWRELAYGGESSVKVSLTGSLDGSDDQDPQPKNEPKPGKDSQRDGKDE